MEYVAQSERAREATRAELETRLLASVRALDAAPAVDLARLDDSDLATSADRLTRLRQACGCAAGAFCMTAALIIGSVLAVHSGATDLVEALVLGIKVLGWSLLAAIVGKIAGLLVARLRWQLERDRLMRQLAINHDGGRHVVLR